jgi:L-fuculose-phosphate aldolase
MDLKTGRAIGRSKPSIELGMYRSVYNVRPDINAIIHAHSSFTIGVSISGKFRHVIEEAKILMVAHLFGSAAYWLG